MQVPPTDFDVAFEQGNLKAAMQHVGAKNGDYLMVPLEDIKVTDGLNLRIQNEDYYKRVELIYDSISENGFFKHKPLPVMICKEGDQTVIRITGGFTRLDAAKLAKERGVPIDKIPVIPVRTGTSNADLQVQLLMDNTGAGLQPYERGIGIKRLANFGWSEDDIARKLVCSTQTVKNMLFLHSLPQEIQDAVITNKLSAYGAIRAVREFGLDEVLRRIREGELDGLEDGVARINESPRRLNGSNTKRDVATSKKMLLAAIRLALSLPNGLEFLADYIEGDTDRIAEVAATLTKKRDRNAEAVVDL